MTRDEALELLKGGPEGVKKWNQWRYENPDDEIPNLSNVKFHSGADLQGVDLSSARLEGAKLHRANLKGADLFMVHLRR